MMTNLSKQSVLDILQLHAEAINELRSRDILRSANNPVGDYAEYLGCKCFGWDLAAPSEKGFDARTSDGVRYQIKSRRLISHNPSRQLSVLRRLPEVHFDWLLGVLFREDFTVYRAALVPHSLVLANSKYTEGVNGWLFLLRDEVWEWEGVKDVTVEMEEAGRE